MPLQCYLSDPKSGACPAGGSALHRGDLVFHITESIAAPWRSLRIAHVGIVVEEVQAYTHLHPVEVVHMGMARVKRDIWGASKQPQVDASGFMGEIDPPSRELIVDAALAFFQRRPSILAFHTDSDTVCYWLGKPYPDSHPLYPNEADCYAFSCATFAHYCYSLALPASIGTLVNIEAMPNMPEREFRHARRFLENHVERCPQLYTGYLMGAFECEEYPFNPDNWEEWADHSRFIP